MNLKILLLITLLSAVGVVYASFDLPSWTHGELGGYTANERQWWYDSSAEGTGFVYGSLKSEQVGSTRCAGVRSWVIPEVVPMPEPPVTPPQPNGFWINIFGKKVWWRF